MLRVACIMFLLCLSTACASSVGREPAGAESTSGAETSARGEEPRPNVGAEPRAGAASEPSHAEAGATTLSRSEIRRVMSALHGDVQGCYERTVLSGSEPYATGRVLVSFLIDPGGDVAEARIGESAIGSDPLHRCLLDLVLGLRFPGNGQTVGINYPFVFSDTDIHYSMVNASVTPDAHPEATRTVLVAHLESVIDCFDAAPEARAAALEGLELRLAFDVSDGETVTDFALLDAPPAVRSIAGCLEQRVSTGLLLSPDVTAHVEASLRLGRSEARRGGAPLTGSAIASVVERERSTIEACWHDVLRALGEPTGTRIEARVEIAPSGSVTVVNLTGPDPGGLHQCVESALRQWRFPAANATTQTRIPFIFQGTE